MYMCVLVLDVMVISYCESGSAKFEKQIVF